MTLLDSFPAFAKELVKLGFQAMRESTAEKVEQHFASPKPDWKLFNKNLRSKGFRSAVSAHPAADEKLKKYVKNYGGFLTSKDEVASLKSKDSGKRYRIKKLDSGRLACGCPDWKYKRSVGKSGCKHIRSLRRSGLLEKDSGAFGMGIASGTLPILMLNRASRAKARALAARAVTSQIVEEDRRKYGLRVG